MWPVIKYKIQKVIQWASFHWLARQLKIPAWDTSHNLFFTQPSGVFRQYWFQESFSKLLASNSTFFCMETKPLYRITSIKNLDLGYWERAHNNPLVICMHIANPQQLPWLLKHTWYAYLDGWCSKACVFWHDVMVWCKPLEITNFRVVLWSGSPIYPNIQ